MAIQSHLRTNCIKQDEFFCAGTATDVEQSSIVLVTSSDDGVEDVALLIHEDFLRRGDGGNVGVTVVEPLLGSKSLYLGGSQVETIRYMDAEVAKAFAAFDG